ncbi:MAG: sigma-54 dependent transcriptional regulator [Pseudomonadota bacterium]|nr:sigma-54 dependent transcriptional regulator [Pseudomonadota bacterium]
MLVLDPGAEGARIDALEGPGRSVHACRTAREALASAGEAEPDVIVASLDTDDVPGVLILEALRARSPGSIVVAVTRAPTVEGAVIALRAGAADYLGAGSDALADAVARALAEARGRVGADTPDSTQDRHGFSPQLTRSPRMMRVFDAIRAVAQTDATVLIHGETGTGKELVARAIHEKSRRRGKRMLAVKCGTFAEVALEAELFGHGSGARPGSFESGAVAAGAFAPGAFEVARGGSVFLDELGETSLALQVNLLRVLEERSFRRPSAGAAGADRVKVDVRLLAGTDVDLAGPVADGRFREDLYYRLNVFPIALPALRDRAEDIPLLLRHFLDEAARGYELPSPTVTPDALAAIARFRWPGNVRQLRAMCERWVIQCRGDALGLDALPAEVSGAPRAHEADGALFVDETLPLATLTERLTTQLERTYLDKLLVREGGHLQNTATAAGITRRTLYSRMKALGLDAKDYK